MVEVTLALDVIVEDDIQELETDADPHEVTSED